MRISDWSSDVCSSDLLSLAPAAHAQEDRLEALERRLAEQQTRIDHLESLIAKQSQMVQQAPATDSPSPANVALALPPSSPAPAASPATTASRTDDGFRLPGLDVRGDMRVQIGRAHVCTPVTNAHLVCRL